MASLPLFKIGNPTLDLWQTQWKSQLDPVLASPLLDGLLLTNIQLVNGTTTINHKLGRKMVGWIVVDIDAGAAVYRSQPLNSLTLTLTSGAAGMCSLWVF